LLWYGLCLNSYSVWPFPFFKFIKNSTMLPRKCLLDQTTPDSWFLCMTTKKSLRKWKSVLGKRDLNARMEVVDENHKLVSPRKVKKKILQTLPTYLYSVVMRYTAEINRVRGTNPMHHAVQPSFPWRAGPHVTISKCFEPCNVNPVKKVFRWPNSIGTNFVSKSSAKQLRCNNCSKNEASKKKNHMHILHHDHACQAILVVLEKRLNQPRWHCVVFETRFSNKGYTSKFSI